MERVRSCPVLRHPSHRHRDRGHREDSFPIGFQRQTRHRDVKSCQGARISLGRGILGVVRPGVDLPVHEHRQRRAERPDDPVQCGGTPREEMVIRGSTSHKKSSNQYEDAMERFP